MYSAIITWFWGFVRLFFPHQCPVCGNALQEGEEGICLRCNIGMPRTHYHTLRDNPVEKLFWGKFPLVRATSFFFYSKESDFRRLVYQLKYNGRQDLGETMGRFMAAELAQANFFRDIDLLLPVPLHPHKLRRRGYNQSECLAQGLSALTNLPIETGAVVRHLPNETQTHKSVMERWDNVSGIFSLRHPERLRGKHVLIIDDVLTTGSTTTACADALKAVEGIRISVLTLAVVRRS